MSVHYTAGGRPGAVKVLVEGDFGILEDAVFIIPSNVDEDVTGAPYRSSAQVVSPRFRSYGAATSFIRERGQSDVSYVIVPWVAT